MILIVPVLVIHILNVANTLSHTHLFRYPCGDFHRRNGFSVQTVYSIALHQPDLNLALTGDFLHF